MDYSVRHETGARESDGDRRSTERETDSENVTRSPFMW